MEKVRLGKSDVQVTPLAFGAWAIGGWMWGGAEKDDAVEALEFAIDRGMTTIDTAPVYGFGRSEEILGEVIRGKSRSSLEILTKYGLNWTSEKGEFHFETSDESGCALRVYKYSAKEAVMAECELSLKRLNTDYIDLYQIHWPDGTTPVDETMEAMERLIEQGKIRAAGVSNYDRDLTSQALNTLAIASNQVPFSMLKRDIETELVPYCIDHQVSILAYSPLQRGLLTGKISPDHRFEEGDSRPATPYFSPENIQKVNDILAKISPIARNHNATLGQLVIRWTLSRPGITVALVGARNRKQVEENLGAMNFELSFEETEEITGHLNDLHLNL